MLIHLTYQLSLDFHFPSHRFKFSLKALRCRQITFLIAIILKFLLLICRMRHYLCAREVQTFESRQTMCRRGNMRVSRVTLPETRKTQKKAAATSLKIANDFSFRFNLKFLINEVFCWCFGRSSGKLLYERNKRSFLSVPESRLFTLRSTMLEKRPEFPSRAHNQPEGFKFTAQWTRFISICQHFSNFSLHRFFDIFSSLKIN